MGTIRQTWTLSCDTFLDFQIYQIWNAEDNVRKRPFFDKMRPMTPCGIRWTVKARTRTYCYIVPRRIWDYRLQSYGIVFNYARKLTKKCRKTHKYEAVDRWLYRSEEICTIELKTNKTMAEPSLSTAL